MKNLNLKKIKEILKNIWYLLTHKPRTPKEEVESIFLGLLLAFFIATVLLPLFTYRSVSTYGGSMPFSSIPQQIIQQVKTNSNKDIQPDGVIFILYYQNDSGYHLVSFKLTDKYGGKEMWFTNVNGQDIEATEQREIATNIDRALESGLHAYVKEGYAVKLQWWYCVYGKIDVGKIFIFKLYHILPETTFNWFRIVHKAEIDKYVFKETFEHYTVTHYTGVYPEFP